MTEKLRVRLNIDGGSRGNPGPAAAGVVIYADDDGTILHEAGIYLGRATNNVAEYSGLVAGLKAAKQLSAAEVVCFSDSELLVKQMNGEYRVRNDGLKPLFAEASALARDFEKFVISHVRREKNKQADSLVNQALNVKRNVEDAAN